MDVCLNYLFLLLILILLVPFSSQTLHVRHIYIHLTLRCTYRLPPFVQGKHNSVVAYCVAILYPTTAYSIGNRLVLVHKGKSETDTVEEHKERLAGTASGKISWASL